MSLVRSVALLLVCAGTAAAAPEAHKVEEARGLYQKAIAHYDLAEYDLAIAQFKQAYELSAEPGLLFNLAQAYRLKGNPAQALHFYRTYLDLKPDAANRADAETQLANMQRAVDEEEARRRLQRDREQADQRTAAILRPAAPGPPPSHEQRFVSTGRGRATIALAAAGGASLIVAAITGGLALGVRASYDAGCDRGACDRALYDRGRGMAIATDVLIPIGAVAAVAALVLGLTRPHARPIVLGAAF